MEVRMVCFDRETMWYYEDALKEQTRQGIDTATDS